MTQTKARIMMTTLKAIDGSCDKNGEIVLHLFLSDGSQETFKLSRSDVVAFLDKEV
jgi:predicted metal-dependent hydrolase|nr:MAG TPA: hypothetical protein [Caudoviricetes sp.]